MRAKPVAPTSGTRSRPCCLPLALFGLSEIKTAPASLPRVHLRPPGAAPHGVVALDEPPEPDIAHLQNDVGCHVKHLADLQSGRLATVERLLKDQAAGPADRLTALQEKLLGRTVLFANLLYSEQCRAILRHVRLAGCRWRSTAT
jgi:hypothetical protein